MVDNPITYMDYAERTIRLTQERRDHILVHVEMTNQPGHLAEVLAEPEFVIATEADKPVLVDHRYYAGTPVTDKFLLVAVKMLDDDAFILTAFFSSRPKRGQLLWTK